MGEGVDAMIPLVTVAQMRALEAQAHERGWTYDDMMEAAGRGLAERVHWLYGETSSRTALGLVGSGNNGGDTLVALAHLAAWGWEVTAYLARPRPVKDPLVQRVVEAGGVVLRAEEDREYRHLRESLRAHDVLLDGLLGTGARPPLKEPLATLMARVKAWLKEEGTAVVAVDVPSGTDCDTGQVADETFPADHTVTMAAVKLGMVQLPALSYLGELHVVDIGLPEDLPAWKDIRREVPDETRVRELLPPRPPDAHKGTFGTVLVVAGSVNFTGAAYLAGKAAYRVGAGLVTLAVPHPLHSALAGVFPEATWLLLPHELGVIAEDAAPVVWEHLQTGRIKALVLGPGFGLENTTRHFLARLLASNPPKKKNRPVGFLASESSAEQERSGEEKKDFPWPPMVVDADGLKLLAQLEDGVKALPGTAVLTPHPGEMAVLTGMSVKDIQARRIEVAESYAQKWGHVVVLKGAGTVIAAPDGRTAVLPVATPALARAGTGDVLAGAIGGLLAQGVPPYEAALAGAWLHAVAGQVAAEILGSTAAVLAGDVLDALPEVLSEIA